MRSEEVRKRFLRFFEKRGHKILPSSSLVPENDPSALFTTAGVQPLVPYILQGKHPLGNRLASIQKCVRTTDIEEIGDNTHITFFEMLGNWSLGDYFKEDTIKWSFELLTSKKEGFGLDPERLYVTVFEGNQNAPRDIESVEIWKKTGLPENRIYFRGKDNWWSPGASGPCGPSTEMFYDLTEGGLGDLTPEEFEKADDEQKVVEIWNDVFMEYQKKDGEVVGKLPNKNVDTGAGFERLLAVLQKKGSVYETDIFAPVISKIREFSKKEDAKAERIIADHIRASVFIVSDGVLPSNTDRGYVLRRLIRRAVRYADMLGIEESKLSDIADVITKQYQNIFSSILQNTRKVKEVIVEEEKKFRKTMLKGIKKFDSATVNLPPGAVINADSTSMIQLTFGLPIDFIEELAKDRGLSIDIQGHKEKFREHQEISKVGSEKKFAGGLADHSKQTIKLHSAHHLLLAALQKVLGPQVHQRGSNITSERLRIDFSFDRKMRPEELKRVEDLVNQKISESLPIERKEMSKEEAEKIGAEMEFGVKYADRVSIYFVKEKDGSYFSKEFCGGPHVKNTVELGNFSTPLGTSFKILKEEASSAGVRRIKAVLQ